MLRDTDGNVQLSMRRWRRLTGESSKRTRRRGGGVRPARVELRSPPELTAEAGGAALLAAYEKRSERGVVCTSSSADHPGQQTARGLLWYLRPGSLAPMHFCMRELSDHEHLKQHQAFFSLDVHSTFFYTFHSFTFAIYFLLFRHSKCK